MNEAEQLRSTAKRRTKSPDPAVRLGDIVRPLVDGRISRQQRDFGPLLEFWSRLLPAELAEHCELSEVCSGRLTVVVDSPSYMYELRLCTSQLLTELQQQCPRAQIRKIKFILG